MTTEEYRAMTEKQFLTREVRTLTKMQNGIMVIPKGSVCSITRKYQGFNLTGPPCNCCGVQIRITRVSWRDVELIQEAEHGKD
jgi:hypothetical protein